MSVFEELKSKLEPLKAALKDEETIAGIDELLNKGETEYKKLSESFQHWQNEAKQAFAKRDKSTERFNVFQKVLAENGLELGEEDLKDFDEKKIKEKLSEKFKQLKTAPNKTEEVLRQEMAAHIAANERKFKEMLDEKDQVLTAKEKEILQKNFDLEVHKLGIQGKLYGENAMKYLNWQLKQQPYTYDPKLGKIVFLDGSGEIIYNTRTGEPVGLKERFAELEEAGELDTILAAKVGNINKRGDDKGSKLPKDAKPVDKFSAGIAKLRDKG